MENTCAVSLFCVQGTAVSKLKKNKNIGMHDRLSIQTSWKKIIFNTSQTKAQKKKSQTFVQEFIIRELGDIYQFSLSHI